MKNFLKQHIKSLASQQTQLKTQRKTVNLVGDRTIDPSSAQSQVFYNKVNLRYLYRFYAEIRGKEMESIKNYSYKDFNYHYNLEDYNKLVDKMTKLKVESDKKLVIITDESLPVGCQSAQGTHVAVQ